MLLWQVNKSEICEWAHNLIDMWVGGQKSFVFLDPQLVSGWVKKEAREGEVK